VVPEAEALEAVAVRHRELVQIMVPLEAQIPAAVVVVDP
jgi:hypothetical protein